jgi:hypothetical protein
MQEQAATKSNVFMLGSYRCPPNLFETYKVLELFDQSHGFFQDSADLLER